MTKKESMAILLACRKHAIYMNSRNEGDDYIVVFLNRLEVRSFEAAKLITNGLVIEGRLKQGIKHNLTWKEQHPVIEKHKHVSKSERRKDWDSHWGENRMKNQKL
jgi:hypothetical protein